MSQGHEPWPVDARVRVTMCEVPGHPELTRHAVGRIAGGPLYFEGMRELGYFVLLDEPCLGMAFPFALADQLKPER